MQNARFQLMHTIDAKLCSHLMFENSFRNIERQNNYRTFLDDRLELWPSIINKCGSSAGVQEVTCTGKSQFDLSFAFNYGEVLQIWPRFCPRSTKKWHLAIPS